MAGSASQYLGGSMALCNLHGGATRGTLQIQPLSSLRTTASSMFMPGTESLRQGM